MKKLLLIPILVLVVSLVLPISAAALTSQIIDLVAGQNMVVGTVEVSNNSTHLRVIYNVAPPLQILETHLAVAESIDDVPKNNKGNPKIGKFPYKDSGDYSIPLGDWTPGTNLVIAAHAVVYNPCEDWEETAWGMGEYCNMHKYTVWSIPFTENGGSWAEYFEYRVQ